ncbi:MAG: hypothetical protein J6R67_07860 [Treponema sp.]|nr:hypothetical protein [Treponema sp.]
MKKVLFLRSYFLKQFVVFCLLLWGTSFVFSVQYWGEGVFADFGFSSKSTLPPNVPLEGTIGFRRALDEATFEGFLSVDEFSFNVAGSFRGFHYKLNAFLWVFSI